MDGLIMAAQLILGLSILVTLHELGHFLPAKWFKTKVDKFYLFFDFLFPNQNLLKFSLFKFKKGDTEYGIGWFPLGGYVKIDGMIDESMDKEFLKSEPKPWEFRSKTAWQRLIIMIGGVTMNVITGVVIFICLTYFIGEKYLSVKEAKYGIVANDLAKEIGLKTGDVIIDVNGQKFDKFNELFSADVLLENGSYYTVNRDGQILKINIPANFIDKISDKKRQNAFVEPIFPFFVGEVVPGSGAAKAGLKKGDKIVGIDSVPIAFFHELQQTLKLKTNKIVTLKVDRNNQIVFLKANVNSEGKLGFHAETTLKEETERFSFVESIGKGTVKAFTIVVVQVKAFRKMFSGDIDVSKSLSGPIGIAKEFGGTWDWIRFWNLTGLLSMVLAFMNLLPIPALDGGHVMFLLYEIVTRRKPSDRFMEVAQQIGMSLLLFLMVYAIFNDLIKLIF
ncbi:MAG: RIP metalloprotease RseP [Bacteroidota bacterium]|nr:RIP metalloprotease RseP [Bacteroidota bacterium]